MVIVSDEILSPAQQQVIDLLGTAGGVPQFPPRLSGELWAELESAILPMADYIGDDTLWISKRALAGLHGCEAHYLATIDNFEWSIPVVLGMVAHKAIELSVHWTGEPLPRELVDDAVARLIDGDRQAGKFLGGLGDGDIAQLRSDAVSRVAAFQECFPPLKPQWRPVTESPARVDLLGGRVVLSGKVDMTLGRPGKKVIIDLKSGRVSPQHREDLRFYALVETLKIGLPPRKIATYYLDQARPHAEDVTEDLLEAALRRTIDGVIKAIELRAGRPATTQPGPACRWCPIQTDCPAGTAYLAESDDGSGW